jgi:hypothetical protein
LLAPGTSELLETKEMQSRGLMHQDRTEIPADEKRSKARPAASRDYRIEIKFVGEPIYQFRLIDVNEIGASILIKNDSAFLKMIKTGKITEANFIAPKDEIPSGLYRIEFKHISKLDKSMYNGHRSVGIHILEKLE